VLQVGLKARGVALGLVCLTCVFIVLWVSIGASIHKDYETPVPVRESPSFIPTLSSLLTPLGSVLVLDRPSLLGRTLWWRNRLDVGRTACFGNTVYSTLFLGGGFLVDRRRVQVSLAEF
jgi:hypothetical protein